MTSPVQHVQERILVVDDEPDIVALVAYHLAKTNYRVSTASNGTDALSIARQERPSLLVLDLMLPGMSGFDVLEHIRAEESTRHIAVLMLTARKEEQDRIRGLSLGADDYLTKPFSPQELVLRVGAILRRTTGAAETPADLLQIGRSASTAPPIAWPSRTTRWSSRPRVQVADHPRRAARRVQARGHLLETVWEAAPDIQTRTVDMHIQRLRTKLGESGRPDRDRPRLRLPHARRGRPIGAPAAARPQRSLGSSRAADLPDSSLASSSAFRCCWRR